LSDSATVVDAHNSDLQHHFANMEQQQEASVMGMWVFLITEIMFFGGMFAGYMIYRHLHYQGFVEGSLHMDFWWGTINTVVLLCSSLTMAMAVRAAQTSQRKAIVIFLLITILFGLAFLGIKAIEYHGHWVEHQFPGHDFHLLDEKGQPSPYTSEAEIFFSFYWAMTGFHALHMVIGVGLVSWIAFLAWRGRYDAHYFTPVENVGLYWHFVDLVWIYLYPLLYLISNKHISG
jgi:cytochrome c oxidase subunit 3